MAKLLCLFHTAVRDFVRSATSTGAFSTVLRRSAYWPIRHGLSHIAQSCRLLTSSSQSCCFHETRVPRYCSNICSAAWNSVTWRLPWFRSIRVLINILEGTHWSHRKAALRVTYNMVAPWCRALPIAKHFSLLFCGAVPLVRRVPALLKVY